LCPAVDRCTCRGWLLGVVVLFFVEIIIFEKKKSFVEEADETLFGETL
jgi:hypothetical protein